jgi:hypothetical protein
MRYLAMTAVAAFILAAPVRADEEKVPLDKVPKAVLDAAKKRFPKGEVKEASKEVADGKTTYEVSMKENGKNIDISLTPEGSITLIEKEVAFKDLPKAVAATLNKKYPKAAYDIIEAVITVADGKETLDYYEAHLTTADKKKIEAEVLPDGKFKSETEAKDEQSCGGADDKKGEKASAKKSKKGDDDEDDKGAKSKKKNSKDDEDDDKGAKSKKKNSKDDEDDDKGAKSKKTEAKKSKKGDDDDDKKSAKGKSSGFQGEQKGQHEDDDKDVKSKNKKKKDDKKGEDDEKDKKKKKGGRD